MNAIPVAQRKETSPTRLGRISLQGIDVWVGGQQSGTRVLHNLSLDIEPGELVCVLGPSGCGKSTLLSAIGGHLPVHSGCVHLDGAVVDGPDPQRGLVFQHHTLFPWKTVLENVAFGLKMKGVATRTRRDEARRMLSLVGLADFEHRYPRELSGGMQQRVEIARVLVNSPRVLLMDEPFGALDALTRSHMQMLLLDLWERLGTTVLFVTHDIDEALFLSDRVVIMSSAPGRILEELTVCFDRPRQVAQLTEPHFISLKRRCLDLLQSDAVIHRSAAPEIALQPQQLEEA